jgi:hypothetical protein
MSERGEYASIPRALAHGPDFQALPERARWAFVMMCLTFNGVGLEVKYPDSFAYELAAQTGATPDEIRAALDVLDEGGWIRREGNVIWLCGRLEHSGLTLSNPKKHVPHVRKVVLGLPRLQIVRDFVMKYREWFVDDPTKKNALLIDSLAWVTASQSIGNPKKKSKPASLSIGNRLPTDSQELPKNLPNQTNISSAPNGASPKNWVTEGSAWWRANVGSTTEPIFGAALVDLVRTHGWPSVFAGAKEYATMQNGRDKRLDWFAKDAVRWIKQAAEPLVDSDGIPTARADRIAAGAA